MSTSEVSEATKQEREVARRALVRHVNKIRQSIAENDITSYDYEIKMLKNRFKSFAVKCEDYQDTLINDDDIAENEKFFANEQEQYIQFLEMMAVRAQKAASRRKTRVESPESIKEISYRGVAVSIFLVLCCSMAFFAMGVLTPAWSRSRDSSASIGLFEVCKCVENTSTHEDWLQTSILVTIIGGVGLMVCIILITVYLAMFPVAKNILLISTILVGFVTVVLLIVAVAVYGANNERLYYSFWMIVTSIGFCSVAIILGFIQILQTHTI